MGTEEGKKPRRQANGEEFKKKSKSRKKRGKEVAAMTSFDIFLRLAILCFLALSQVRAKSKHYLIETKDHKDDDPRLRNLNRYGKWPPTTKWPEPTTTTTWTTTATTTTPEPTTTTTWTTTTTTWTTTPPPTTTWKTTTQWPVPTPKKWHSHEEPQYPQYPEPESGEEK